MKENKTNDLTPVFVAAGAIAFFVVIVPILDAFGGWVSNVFGLQSVKLNHKASKYTQDEEVESRTQAVGFAIPNEDDDYE